MVQDNRGSGEELGRVEGEIQYVRKKSIFNKRRKGKQSKLIKSYLKASAAFLRTMSNEEEKVF